MADCIFVFCVATGAAAADDDSVDGGKILVWDCGGDVGDAGEDAPERFGVCGDGYVVGGVVCGGVGADEKSGTVKE